MHPTLTAHNALHARQNDAQNPFGAAKPREAVLSTRLGKSEEEILKEEIRSERPKVRCVHWVAWRCMAHVWRAAACNARGASILLFCKLCMHAYGPPYHTTS